MSLIEPYAGEARKLFVSFDIGTTFSGISYCIAHPGRVPEIKTVTRFPSQEQIGGNAKIPTVLLYDDEGVVTAVGAETLLDSNIEAAEVEGWSRAEWFKLRLAPASSNSSLHGYPLPPLPPRKSVHDVLTDFIAYLLVCLRTFIEETHPGGDALWTSLKDTAEFSLTHPNGWGGAQQAKMRSAALDAGLVRDHADAEDRVRFVTEGEASLHFCCHHGLVLDAMQEDDGVILVDAGGGTIDLSAYATNGTSSKATFSEIAASKCLFQGSVFVTRRAEEYFRTSFKDTKWEADISYMTQIFDKHAKLTIKNSSDPALVKFGTFKDSDPALSVRNGQLKISGATAAGFFTPSIDAIYNAVLEQMAMVQVHHKRISSVYVVGGFGASSLLFTKLKAILDKLDIDVCRPDTHVNKAVADGGVLFLLNGRVTTRVSRYTYGVRCSALYRAWDPAHYLRKDTVRLDSVSGYEFIPGCFTTVLPVNTQISQEQEFRHAFYNTYESRPSGSARLVVHLYRGSKAKPCWIDEDKEKFSVLCTIKAGAEIDQQATFETNEHGKNYWRLEFDVALLLGLTEIKAQIIWKDAQGTEKRGPATVIYDH
ncbi:hypothetical protein K523DRAFT_284377 [Schizophyllum commune Tattone D]|nr:hypothetical protein K523DRAFT_284377 [Schizophyllum commune Tattone D]